MKIINQSNILEEFTNIGVTSVFDVDLNNELIELQEKIYEMTKDIIIDHNNSLPTSEKIRLPFKTANIKTQWSEIMSEINKSRELENMINSNKIKNVFKYIFKDPERYEICTFRARFPDQERVVYDWHQDEGTWYLSKNRNLLNKFTATMWFSVNGSDEANSIQVVKYSHKNKLFEHKFIKGQGYFHANINNQDIDINNIKTIKTKASQAIIFHPLSFHRSVPTEGSVDFRPRYSIDIRYFDNSTKLKYKTSLYFKIKKIFNR